MPSGAASHDPASALVGSSERMATLRAQITRFARSGIPVLLHGPTGSGKELVAAAIHRESGRSGSMVAINVCAIPDTMFEDTLFGHVHGAFTGATSEMAGVMAEANGGTLFLDEISALPLSSQAKLLRAIDAGVFRPVGAPRDRVSDFRIIAATNESLSQLVATGHFRSDLLHRLGGVVFQIPSLRERIEDIPELVDHFLARIGSADRCILTGEALRQLAEHRWSGNVRELRHAVERISVLAQGASVTREVVRAALESSPDASSPAAVHHTDEARQFVGVLDQHGWNTAEVARQLGVHRATIYRRMERLGIPLSERR